MTNVLYIDITVFNISVFDNVRYYFVDFIDIESEREIEFNIFFSVRIYFEVYYVLDESDDKFGLLFLFESFEGRNFVTEGIFVEI